MICHRCFRDWSLAASLVVVDADPGGGIPRWRCQCGHMTPWRAAWGREHKAGTLHWAKVN